MKKMLYQTLLSIILAVLAYFGNQDYLFECFFLILIVNLLANNYFVYPFIIPIYFQNSVSFFILAGFELFLFLINKFFTKQVYRNSSLLVFCLGVFSYLMFNHYHSFIANVLIFAICALFISLDYFLPLEKNSLSYELLTLIVFTVNTIFIDVYTYLFAYLLSLVILTFINRKNYNYLTSLIVFLCAFYKTQNYALITMQIMAYLTLLLNKTTKKENDEQMEYLLEDINENITSFCSFITAFTSKNFQNDHEKKLSLAIKILIENFCANCKNRNFCYADKKMQTYIYLKGLLTSKNNNTSIEGNKFFGCIYYPDLVELANSLQTKYALDNQVNPTPYKLDSICTSIQNYFLTMFERINPQMLHIINLQSHLKNHGIVIQKYHQNIVSLTMFEIEFEFHKSQQKSQIENLLTHYFKDIQVAIEISGNQAKIHPQKEYKVLYDSATLSHNNYQLSGDNFLFKTIGEAMFICALSDGMGSGYYAYQLSKETLEMVDQITNCQIDFDTSLDILNNFFKTRDLNEAYATLDFVNINLNNGQLNLYKLGSSTTFIIRNDTIIPIYNNNLPFGIDDLVTKEQYLLQDNDLIILVSDGISDYINETQLTNYILKLKNESPHKIVYEILQKIYYLNNGQIKDDMSCAAIRVQHQPN